MQSTASEEAAAAHYGFSFSWEGPYGNVVRLLERIGAKPGVIIDLGCSVGAIADPLVERGYEYAGADIDRDALKQLSTRGFETHEIDLSLVDRLADQMVAVADGRHVAAVLLLDVIEHMPSTHEFLSALKAGLDRLGRPFLLTSVPNVSHIDVAAKLVFGKWEYTETGLLDATHLQLFTAARLDHETRHAGLLEVDSADFQLRFSDQHFPPAHPAVSSASPIASMLRAWREAADPHADTVQFIRAFVACDIDPASTQDSAPTATPAPFLTVVMRTQGGRMATLRDALTCLAAQTDDDFDVLLMLHSDTPHSMMPVVVELVAEFHPTFASRVTLVHVAGGDRARPLNVALERLRADYVAFLDDDDLVTANWVETFAQQAGAGAIVRSVGSVRHVSVPPEGTRVPYIIESPLEFRYHLEFDRVHHLWGNETPICTFAVPRDLITTFGLRFDEQLPVLEDWDFLMRCAALAPVRDTREVTSIYQMWRRGESSGSLHHIDLWQATQRVLQGRTNQRPLVLPAGYAARLVSMCEQLVELDAARQEASAAREEAARHAEKTFELAQRLKDTHDKYIVTITSRRWRMLGPAARAIAAVRGIFRRRR